MNRLYALDLLRFLAALSVVLYHYINRPEALAFEWLAPVTQYGYLGVPIFFMISGYVIAVSASNRSPLGFLVARAVRLYPAYWVGLLLTVSVLLLTGEGVTLVQFLANITMLNDLVGVGNLDGVYWTLHAELRFYGCIFLLMLFGVFKRFYIWLSVWLLATLIYGATGQPFFMGWFISPVYSPFFIAGITFYLLQRDGLNIFLMTLLGVTCITAVMRAYALAPSFIVGASNEACLVSALVILLSFIVFLLLVSEAFKVNKSNILPVLGAMTYPLYLIHNVAGRIMIDGVKPLIGEEMAIVVTVGGMLMLSLILAKYVEPKVTQWLKNMIFNIELLLAKLKVYKIFGKSVAMLSIKNNP